MKVPFWFIYYDYEKLSFGCWKVWIFNLWKCSFDLFCSDYENLPFWLWKIWIFNGNGLIWLVFLSCVVMDWCWSFSLLQLEMLFARGVGERMDNWVMVIPLIDFCLLNSVHWMLNKLSLLCVELITPLLILSHALKYIVGDGMHILSFSLVSFKA